MYGEATEARLAQLRRILLECESVCIGYSGGVDSVFLARISLDVLGADRVLAVTGLSPAYPAAQRRVALECARLSGIAHVEIETRELDDPEYAANPANRCYFCKSELWPALRAVADRRGLRTVLDGSNADDAQDYRPGFQAALENGVRSPLLEAGLTKQEIRELSREYGLPTWDQPSSPCLASRLPYGVAVTPTRLRQVEQAEDALRAAGLREFRVRHHDDCLRVEIAPAELDVVTDRLVEIADALATLDLPRVLVDAEGYRRGALNEALVQLGGSRAPDAPSSALPPHAPAGFHGDIAVVETADLSAARRAAPALRHAGFRYLAVDLAHAAAHA